MPTEWRYSDGLPRQQVVDRIRKALAGEPKVELEAWLKELGEH